MCFPVSANGLNYSTYNNNNTQETRSNYTKNTEKLQQQKNLNDYTINTKEGHKLKKISSFILNAIKYFLYVVFFPITIIVLIIRKLTSLKSTESILKDLVIKGKLEETTIKNLDYSAADQSINENSMEDAYNKMFDSDEFRKIKEIQNKNMTAIEKKNFLSKLFITDIENELGQLNQEELQIIETMKALPDFKFQHQSTHKLVNNNILKIYSRDKIELIDTKSKISLNDVLRDKELQNTDFVFFSVDFSGSSIKTPPTIVTHANVFYGENSYVIPANIIGENGYFTLVDHATSTSNSRSETLRVLYMKGMKKLFGLFDKVSRRITSSKYHLTPMFSSEDIRLGMALYIIKSIRQVDKAIATEQYKAERESLHNQRAKFMECLLEGNEIQNQLLNSILHLEYHVPAMVKLNPGEYAEHKVSKASAHRK